ncbi:insulin-degrading enzyme isoform X2 [Phymastichus coffea]|uniref:insulin-degrading enzyme isoform X2 n=1 Tax=Phymastichus coffea TaxID=108790 RepID=UPI00273BF983|nr:insulin-degrading enzyme isoform X2 [Phymastichus coffea]
MSLLHQSTDPSKRDDCTTVNKSTDMVASAVKHQPKEPIRFNNIIKSYNDKRNYRGLILHNKLKVLLISDPTTDKSAASLDVNVGYLSDPKELPGLAHFCEHMLFLGTNKYPETNDYNSYLSQNGGAGNAATYLDHTNYYFDVNPDSLEGALDRFSQFFICPLFTESVTDKEINAVHSEHEKNLPNDIWRLDQLDKSSADPNHPYSKFGTGSKETLVIIPKEKNINVREELFNFYNTWYSANIMSLSVLGKENLDELEKMIVQMFSDIENKNVEAPKWTEHPFMEEHFKMKWSIVPVKDLRNLNITFPIPDLQEHFRAAPVYYWSHLLGHEGKGSLLSELKKKGWCNSLMTGKKSSARGFDFYSINVDLTEEGLLHVDDIITMTFQYINMLKREGPVQWIFKEYSNIATMNFRFREKSSPSNYVDSTVQSLQQYPIEEVLSAPRLVSEWRPDLINDVMTYLKPENIRVHVLAKAFENEADSVEPWYGTKYKKEKIPDELIARWSNAGENDAFHLPEKNEFIPSKFDIKPHDKVDKFPVIIEDNPLFRVWFKQDDEFLYPKASMTFDFVSPLAYIDPMSSNMTYMFAQLFKDSLNEYAYNADLAGLKWELNNSKYGLSLLIGGYDHKLDVLLEKILDRMMNFTVNEKRFDILKENYIRGLKNFEAEQPYQHAAYYLAVLLSEQVWIKNELLNACSMLTAERVQQFIPMLMSKMHIECLIHGNITKSEALKTIKMVESKLTSSVKDLTPLLPRQLVLYRELELPNGCHFLYEVENKHHKSSCTQIYYQTGMQSTESNVLLELFTQIISEPCYNILRTKEQLGYIVFSGVRRQNSVQGLRVIVQSNKHPQYVEERINAFMESMQEYIENMSEEDFNMHKESLATHRLEKPKMMRAQSAIYWAEIANQQYNFDRANIEVAHMRTITKQQILDFFKNVVQLNSPEQHKLCIHVVSTAEGGAGTQDISSTSEDTPEEQLQKHTVVEEPVRINDILQFKTSHPLYPLVKPFNNISRKGTQQQSKL